MGTRAKQPSGFTLLELMVVIVIIGIMSAMIIPAMMGTFNDALLRTSAREVINVCHVAYSRAVSLNQTQRVKFDTQTGEYHIERRARQGDSAARFVVVERDVPGGAGKIDTRIVMEFRDPAAAPEEEGNSNEPSTAQDSSTPTAELQENTLTFYPDGTAEAAEIRMRDREGFGLALRINPITAIVQLAELARK